MRQLTASAQRLLLLSCTLAALALPHGAANAVWIGTEIPDVITLLNEGPTAAAASTTMRATGIDVGERGALLSIPGAIVAAQECQLAVEVTAEYAKPAAALETNESGRLGVAQYSSSACADQYRMSPSVVIQDTGLGGAAAAVRSSGVTDVAQAVPVVASDGGIHGYGSNLAWQFRADFVHESGRTFAVCMAGQASQGHVIEFAYVACSTSLAGHPA